MIPTRKGVRSMIHILLVEDNPADVRLTQEAFKETGVPSTLHVVRDGAEAIDFLQQDGRFVFAPRPDMILLDLNLPKKDGRQVLTEIKSDINFRSIPIVILTTSKAEEDIQDTYNHYANCYITKPTDLDDFIQIVKQIEQFWLSIVQLP